MAKAIMETSLDTNLNISTDEIVHASVDTSGVFMGEQYRVKRICTKTDNDLKAVMDAHLEEQASHYSKARS
ncbi:hypothetical protein [Desulfitobacterium sp.]|uniref:hypothetical protein n=1 Tax=Desulfitobacterium sp. TaxID=49981 RepID=UPI002B78045E|nr:hypothetical protein [Desulfitobacterium sp.]HVJ48449.1 hypothetical protein [Desulfitobacterium sp.]